MTESYVCIDLETTGLDPKRDKIIEIGVVKMECNKVVREWETYVNPHRKLEERITELTGIIEEVLPDLFEILGNDVLLGHGILFDYSFLKKAAVDHKMAFERSGIDTLKIARKYLADLESRRLGYLCGYYGIYHSAHRALGDARATVKLYQKLSEAFYEKAQAEEEPNPFRPKPLCYRVKRDTPLTVSQKEQLYKLMDRHKLVLDMDIAKLTRSEASRQIDRLLAVYGR